MASKRRASLIRRNFIPFIFGDGTITHNTCLPIYANLEQDPTEISQFMTDEDMMVTLLSNFDHYASRIAQFFTLINRHHTSRSKQGIRRMSVIGPGIADELIENVLFSLLGEEFQHYQLQLPFLDMFAAIIDFTLPYHSRPLETLAKRLLENEPLFGALVAGWGTAMIMREWTALFKVTMFDAAVICSWTRRLVEMCKSCEIDHGISEQIETFRRLEDICGKLASIIHDHTRDQHAITSTETVPSSTITSNRGPLVPPDVIEALIHFKIEPPTSVPGLGHVFTTLKTQKTLQVLLLTASSFPCRPCFETATDPSAAKAYDPDDEEEYYGDSGVFMFMDILGDSLGIWRVLVSAQALKDMQDARIQGDFHLVKSKLVQLASGDWIQNSLCNAIGSSPLNLAHYPGNGAVLWQMDIGFDEESDTMKQLVKIWRIGNIKMVLQAVKHILSVHKTYPAARVRACHHVLIDQGTKKNHPDSFSEEFHADPEAIHGSFDRYENPAASLFQFNKFYMLTQLTIDNVLAGRVVCEYPLTLAQDELAIVRNSTTSTLILGRSGTGKTTCLVYKLLARYVATSRAASGRQKRQVLLTRSSVLSQKLETYTKNLIATQLGERESTEDLGKEPANLVGMDDREVYDTVFSIKEHDLPLVCTFNRFLKMLENTVRAADRKDFSLISPEHQSRIAAPQGSLMSGTGWGRRLIRKPQVVDFEVFSGEYWPSFPIKLTKRISPTLAFMEIIGVIKGSACRLGKLTALSRDEYRDRGYKISPVEVDRDALYDIYQYYEKQKVKYSDVDDIDRARSVLQAIQSNPELKKRIEGAFDEIYVDEVQDQRLLEIMMLLHLIKTPNAIHFGGDTAQAISKDSVFRFAHLKDLIYQRFPSNSLTKPYELYKNYRTHQGILSVATCVMRLLIGCFPLLVDRLQEELGQFSGPKPTVFVGFDERVFSSRGFGAASLDDDDARFGAEQVIIVRDIAEKNQLKDAIGDFALILTVMESKGMEFEDVLLYDFFSTNKCISDYRALANSANLASFDAAKHIALCSELKQLYVSITRAQNRLWFFESKEAHLAPMLSLWMGQDPIVEVAHARDKNIGDKLRKLRPGTHANPEVWSTKGYEFIHKKDYENALFCFGRSKDRDGEAVANGFIAERKGKVLLATGDETRAYECFRIAINLFHKCKYTLNEAACYEIIGESEKAADLYHESGEYGRAGSIYDKLNLFQKAVTSYSRAKRYNDGASALARGQLFDDLVYYLNDHGQHLDSASRLHYSRLCNLLLKRGKISPALEDLTIAVLRSDTEKEEFFKEYEMTSHLLKFYIDRRRYSDACKLAMKDGDLDQAWQIDQDHGGMNDVSQKERVDLFNYIQAKCLFGNMATEPDRIFSSDACWNTECSWLSDTPFVLEFWRSLPQRLNEYLTHTLSYASITFESAWMKQIFDLIVVLRASAITSSATKIEQLPIESVNEVLIIAREMMNTQIIPPSLLIMLRISAIRQDTGSYLILDSSPLLGTDGRLSCEADTVIRWVLKNVCGAVDSLDDKAKELYDQRYPCNCRWVGRCRGYHEPVTPIAFEALTTDALRMNSVFCYLVPLYHMRFGGLGPEGFSERFRPRQRKYQELLLARITFVSSIENDARYLVDTRTHILKKNSPYFGAFGALQELLFHKVRKGLVNGSDFSSILELAQIASALGVGPHFWRVFEFGALKTSEQSRRSWETFRKIEACWRAGIDERCVKTLDTGIKSLRSDELYSYHAICSIYEEMATYLIYKINPQDFLLPSSWIDMYLIPKPHLFTVQDPAPPASNVRYGEALLLLIDSFCDLITQVGADSQFWHKLTGKPRAHMLGRAIFIRRNIDFLVCCALGAFSWQRPTTGIMSMEIQRKYWRMRNRVTQVLRSPFADSPELSQSGTEYDMAKAFVSSFNSYHGKDALRLVKATRNTGSSFAFLKVPIPVTFLESLQSRETTIQDPASGPPVLFSKGESLLHAQTVLAAVPIIQRMWKERYGIIQKRRVYFKGPEGQAILFMKRVCNAVAHKESLGRKEKMWRKGLHFSQGLDVYFKVKRVKGLYLEKRAEVQARMDVVEAGEMEQIQFQWERLLALQERISQSEHILLEHNWQELDIPARDLSQKYEQVMGNLVTLEIDIGMIEYTERQFSAAVVIQNMWRTRYPILQERRVFVNTPSGKGVSYMHRMYSATLADSPLDRIERLRSAAILFTEGLEIYETVIVVEREFLRAKDAIRDRMVGADMKILPLAEEQQTRMSEIRVQLRKSAGFLSEKNWNTLDISRKKLKERCSKTMSVLKSIQDEIQNLIG